MSVINKININNTDYDLVGQENYSTTEQVIGRWIDGKPLYQKTISTTAISGTTGDLLDISGLNIDTIVDYKGMIKDTDNNLAITSNYYYANNDAATLWIQNNIIKQQLVSAYYRGKTIYITLKYTKTTD